MAIQIKTEEEINTMRESGKILAETLELVCEKAVAGVSTLELDEIAEEFIKKHEASPTFKGYNGFPNTLCTAVNEKIVHGIPRKNEILKEGDLISIDCGVTFKGMITDAARTIAIGEVSKEKEKLIKVAQEALSKGIDAAQNGAHLNDIGKAIQDTVEQANFRIIKDLTGHGVGKKLHEDPVVLNYFDGTPGPILKPGMTLAIEPIFAISTSEMVTMEDNWTIITKDNSCAVQAENTILITQNGPEILTIR